MIRVILSPVKPYREMWVIYKILRQKDYIILKIEGRHSIRGHVGEEGLNAIMSVNGVVNVHMNETIKKVLLFL